MNASETKLVAASAIFLGTYAVLALGRLPGLRIDRTGAAIIGASLMLAFGVLTVEEAYAAIDYKTIVLLFGMMIVVANLRLSGFFTFAAAAIIEHLHRPIALLGAVVAVAGVFSAFFVNDTICLALTPLIAGLTRAAGLNPVPYLLAVAMASNIGSVATITGNPQNMMIGAFSGIPYREFSAALAPVAIFGMFICFGVIALLYRQELGAHAAVCPSRRIVRVNRVMMWKSLVVSGGMILFFFLGWPVAQVALIGGAVLLITRRVKPQKVYHEIDWPLLVLFIGLFIVVAGIEKALAAEGWLQQTSQFPLYRQGVLTTITAILSNLLGNVPAVLVLRPVVAELPNPQHAWLIVAMASTLAGNLTLLGSVANLIVVERARRENIHISFRDYLKAGLPLGTLSLAAGMLFLWD